MRDYAGWSVPGGEGGGVEIVLGVENEGTVHGRNMKWVWLTAIVTEHLTRHHRVIRIEV